MPQGFTYKVRRGETPTTLAQRYGITPEQILRANPGGAPFSVGQTVRIPGSTVGLPRVNAPDLSAPTYGPREFGYLGAQITRGVQSAVGYNPQKPPVQGSYPQAEALASGLRSGFRQTVGLEPLGGYKQPRFDTERGPAGPNPQAVPRVNAQATQRVGSEIMATGTRPNYKADIIDQIFGGNVPDNLSLWQADYANQVFAAANPGAPPLYINGVANPEVTGGSEGGSASVEQRGGSSGSFFQYRGEKSGGFVRGRGGDRNWGARGRRLGARGGGGGEGGGGGGGGSTQSAPSDFGLVKFGSWNV